MAAPLKTYPLTEPFDQGYLAVSDIHSIYYEQVGNPNGKVVAFLHGGPGGTISPYNRIYFDPEVYRVVYHEQRGAGRSEPQGCVTDNTTWDLVEDMEKLRRHLNIETWLLFGGSWGATLALLYAETHPKRVTAMVLRGVWLNTKQQVDWLYEGGGASQVFPECWEKYVAPIPEEERNNIVAAYYKRIITGTDEKIRKQCGKSWSQWETSIYRLIPNPDEVKNYGESDYALVISSIECHYFYHNSWLSSDNQIIDNIDKISHIPCTIVQGRFDIVCPPISAYNLYKAYPSSELRIVVAGHCSDDVNLTVELVAAMEKYKSL